MSDSDVTGSGGGELQARGVNGLIKISGDWLTIERYGIRGHERGTRRIPLASINGVQFRPAGWAHNGFVKLIVSGTREAKSGVEEAAKDENAVIFTRGRRQEFDAVRTRIEQYIAAKHAPAPTGVDVTGQLARLGELRDSGVLTDQEFEEKKAELLRRL